MGNWIGSAVSYSVFGTEENCKILRDAETLESALKDGLITNITTQNVNVSWLGGHNIIILHLIEKTKHLKQYGGYNVTTRQSAYSSEAAGSGYSDKHKNQEKEYKIGLFPDYVSALQHIRFFTNRNYKAYIEWPVSIKYNKNIKSEYNMTNTKTIQNHDSMQFNQLRLNNPFDIRGRDRARFRGMRGGTSNDTNYENYDDLNYYGFEFDTLFQVNKQYYNIQLSPTTNNKNIKIALLETTLFSNDIIEIICLYSMDQIETLTFHAPEFQWDCALASHSGGGRGIINKKLLSMKYIDFRDINFENHTNMDDTINLALYKCGGFNIDMNLYNIKNKDLRMVESIWLNKVKSLDVSTYMVCIPHSFILSGHLYKIMFPEIFIGINELIINIDLMDTTKTKESVNGISKNIRIKTGIIELYPNDKELVIKKLATEWNRSFGSIELDLCLLRKFCDGIIINKYNVDDDDDDYQRRFGCSSWDYSNGSIFKHFQYDTLYLWNLDVIQNHCKYSTLQSIR